MDLSISLSELMALALLDPICSVGLYHGDKRYSVPCGLLYHAVKDLSIYPDVFWPLPDPDLHFEVVENLSQLPF